ncbi:retrovirus-related pol polyprotein from transposon TNT 1-94 [Tanacetum coccineum]
MCVKCNSSMFDARHELCFLEFVSDMNASSKSKSVKKAKKKEEWKPTGKVFTKIGYNWRPTGRTFTLVGNACPLTRITATNKVPLREPIPLEVVAQESVVTKVYTRRPKVPKTNGSNSKPKIAKSVISNKTEPGTSRGSNTSVAPSSSSLVDLRNIHTDNETEFINQTLLSYYESVGISHETSVARTPQQNGIVERRNSTLVEAAQTMLIYTKVPLFLWAEAVTTPFPVAVAPRAVDLADSPVSTSIDQDAPSTSIPSTQDQEHSLIMSQGFEESPKTPHFHDDPLHESLHEDSTSQGSSSNVRPTHTPFESLGRWTKDHPIANVIRDPSRSISTRKQLQTDAMWCYFDAFLTSVEPKNFKQAMTEPSWIDAMQEEIHEFERLEVWELVSCLDKVMLIKLKWIYKVKSDEFGRVLKNKASNSTNKNMTIFQWTSKNGFLKGELKEELLFSIKKDFVDHGQPSHVLQAQRKDHLRLKQTSLHVRQCCHVFTYSAHFSKGAVDPTLFTQKARNDLLRAYSDVDHVRCQDTRCSTSGSAQFLCDKLVSWSSKKQNSTAISSTEAEYIGCCAQILWICLQLTDYGFQFNKIPLYCDNKSALALCCNNVQHSIAKHIDVRYHFIKEQVENGIVELYFV